MGKKIAIGFLAATLCAAAPLKAEPANPVASATGMEKEPEPTKPILWDIYLSIGVGEAGHVDMLVATVEAADANEAIEKAPTRLKQGGGKLMAVPAYREGPVSKPTK